MRKGSVKKESQVCGYYIAYKFIEGTIYCFDDDVVNSTVMLTEYEANLIFYRRAVIPTYAWDIDFGFIRYILPDLYGQKRYSLRGSLLISIDLNQAQDDNQPVFPEPVAITVTLEVTPLQKTAKKYMQIMKQLTKVT